MLNGQKLPVAGSRIEHRDKSIQKKKKNFIKDLEKMTTERDLRNQMAYARKEAIEEGHAEELAKGRQD